jgi:hypothetical protein
MSRPARLDDPDEHYPYKRDHVRSLLAENPSFGPNGPDDNAVQVTDVLSERIADASGAYIDAQARVVEAPTDENRADYRAARDTLIAARQAHRANRVDEQGRPTMGIIGIRSGSVETFKGA